MTSLSVHIEIRGKIILDVELCSCLIVAGICYILQIVSDI